MVDLTDEMERIDDTLRNMDDKMEQGLETADKCRGWLATIEDSGGVFARLMAVQIALLAAILWRVW